MRELTVSMAVKLRKIIKEKRGRYSQEEFGRDISVGLRTVSSWEHKTKAPRNMTMAARCNCLCLADTEGITTDQLKGES